MAAVMHILVLLRIAFTFYGCPL